jgi:hypothetical protein
MRQEQPGWRVSRAALLVSAVAARVVLRVLRGRRSSLQPDPVTALTTRRTPQP